MFLSLSAGDQLGGRISIQLFKDTPVGATRFAALTKGRQGVGYARSQIDGIAKVPRLGCVLSHPCTSVLMGQPVQGFISSSGVKSLNYGSSQDDPDFAELDLLEARGCLLLPAPLPVTRLCA